MIWLTVGKTHDAMHEFMMKDFKNHSSINGEYIKFMCQNNNSDEISTYKTDLANLETKTNTMKTDLNVKIKNVSVVADSSSKISVNLGNKVKLLEEASKKYATKAEVAALKKP